MNCTALASGIRDMWPLTVQLPHSRPSSLMAQGSDGDLLMSNVDYDELLKSVFSEVRPVGEVMSRNLVVVHADDPAIDAALLLVERKISGLPVVDDDMILVGIITEKDVLKLLIEVDPDKRVRDYMTSDVKSFDESKSVVDICAHLFLNDIKRVPIVKDSKLVGVVSRRDVIREILRLRGQA
jgi:CBS domain-containing protein